MQSPFLSRKHWPAVYVPETVFRHFLNTKYYTQHRNHLSLYEREDLLNALKSNDEFAKFWTSIQEKHPAKKDYFLSLLNEAEPFDSYWLEDEYKAYLKQKAFEALSKEERRTLQIEFNELLPSAYQAALEGESRRLNCDITDVMATSSVLPWEPDQEEESMLASLSDQLFGRVFHFLESLDIFRMTLVCKRWKRLVDGNAMELKRAEHSVTTHMITFTEWMDHAKTPDRKTFVYQYQTLSWCLTKWYCGVSENLKTLILDHPVPYNSLAILLQSCPNLKHLRVGYDLEHSVSSFVISPPRLHLQNLEVFMFSSLDHWIGCSKPCRQIYRDILSSSSSLRVFKGALNSGDLVAISARNPVSNVFNKLVALDLEKFTLATLEFLAQIDDLPLKYLRLGFYVCNSSMNWSSNKERLRNAFHQLLPKLNKLEMLRMSEYIGVTNKTIRLMTDLQLNINWAVLYHAYFPPQYGGELNAPSEINPFQSEDLEDFRNMLLLRNPDIDLSEIQFVLENEETLEALDAMSLGFTFLTKHAHDFAINKVHELYDPKIKQRLGIEC